MSEGLFWSADPAIAKQAASQSGGVTIAQQAVAQLEGSPIGQQPVAQSGTAEIGQQLVGQITQIPCLICKSKNNTVVEYALRDVNKPIGVSEYAITRNLPDALKSALPSIEAIEAELGDAHA